MIRLDGSHGEGGGQILRSALGLSAITGRPVRIDNVRAKRRKPGLAPQHLTTVLAIAEICDAEVTGAELRSTAIEFHPRRSVQPGQYNFDVASVIKGGSAGSAPLIMQALTVPLALSGGPSQITIHGGTHVSWSPSYDYLCDVWLPMLRQIGISAALTLRRCGWYPVGGGQIDCSITGSTRPLEALRLQEPGSLTRVTGRAIVSKLPGHIAHRMVSQASDMLSDAGIDSEILAEDLDAPSPGTGIFLTALFEHVRGGFAGLGERGKPAEAVATEAVEALLAHVQSGAAIEDHLADQLILPLSIAGNISDYTVRRPTSHLKTHAWLVEAFSLATVTIDDRTDGTARVRIDPSHTAIIQ